MSTAEEIVFLVYAGILAGQDVRTGRISVVTAAAGALCGAMMTAGSLISGTETAGPVLASHMTALIWGLGLLLLARLTRGALGKGDGICFCSFACWWDAGRVFALLLTALLLSAAAGSVYLLLKKKSMKGSLPFLPFVFAAAVILCFVSLSRPA